MNWGVNLKTRVAMVEKGGRNDEVAEAVSFFFFLISQTMLFKLNGVVWLREEFAKLSLFYFLLFYFFLYGIATWRCNREKVGELLAVIRNERSTQHCKGA